MENATCIFFQETRDAYIMPAGTLCIGYDVESDNPKTTRLFLDAMVKVHESHDAPCTLFIKGKTLEKNKKQIKALLGNSLIDIQQHTYTHLIFKRIDCYIDNIDPKMGIKHEIYGNNEPINIIKEDVEKATSVFKQALGIFPIGLTTPYAFYQGLTDRPDILKVLHDAGIRFMRSWGRNEAGYCPVPLDVQPFFYTDQGFPDMLECPVNGWQDCIWREANGYTARWDTQFNSDLDATRNGGYIALCQHDWSSIQQDQNMSMTAAIIDHARENGASILHYQALYDRELKKRND
jgi:peptidoglycan/xylan/chitin deacetylase (PgdA/CDA1 family)